MTEVVHEVVDGDGAPGRDGGSPLRVGVLSSARAPGLDRLMERGSRPGAPYRVVGAVVTDREGEAAEAVHGADVPAAVHDVRAFHEQAGRPLSDRAARERYDRVTVELLRSMGADLVLMCGYLFVVTDVLLEAFPGRVINIHDADLTLTDEAGVPVYRGLRSTRDAVFAGEPETRTTVHLATREVDEGPPLVRSRAFPVHPMVEQARSWGAEDLLKAYAYAQREWMMRACWGALLDRALELVADGRVRVVGKRAVVDGGLGPEVHDERIPAAPRTMDRPRRRGGRRAAPESGGRSEGPTARTGAAGRRP